MVVANLNMVINACLNHEVGLIDIRAHMKDALMDSFLVQGGLNKIIDHGARLTIKVYPTDDADVLADIIQIVESFQNSADYIVVLNPAIHSFNGFSEHPVKSILDSFNAKQITLPRILQETKQIIARYEDDNEVLINFEEALEKNIFPDPFHRGDVRYYLKKAFLQYSKVASYLLPDERADKIEIPIIDDEPTKLVPRKSPFLKPIKPIFD
jgi:hypothetical protein